MTHRVVRVVTAVIAFSGPTELSAQQSAADRKPWSVEDIHGPSVPLKLTVDEGTWMSLDVAPDGRTIVFDLLGDLYAVPISGGSARRLTSGPAWDAAPRFSPDGRRILFTSDRSGSDQLWLVDADGASPRQITHDAGAQLTIPSWTPDGRFVIAHRQPLPVRGGAGTWTLLHVDGGSGTPAVDSGGMGLVASADGRWFYVATASGTGANAITGIARIDRRTGARVALVAGYDNLARPMPSHDGRRLAFVATIDGARVLMVRDLETSRDRLLYRGLDVLEQWGSDDLDNHPAYAFTPDDQAIVLAANGKLRRIDIASGNATVIPFTAEIDQTLTGIAYFKMKVAEGPLAPKVLHWAQPLGANRLVFGAAGRVYLYDIATRRATPFAAGPGLQYAPAVSPDGRWIAYVNWTDSVGGHVMKAPVDGGAPVTLSSRPGRFQSISWSPDARRLVLAEENQNSDWMATLNYDFHLLDAERGGRPLWVATMKSRGERKAIPRPVFDATGERLLYSEPDSNAMTMYSMSLEGRDRVRLGRSPYADELVPSPDGHWAAFVERQDVYLAALPPAGKVPAEFSAAGGSVPIKRLSTDGADYLYWLDGGKSLGWSWGPKVSRVDIAAATGGGTVQPVTTTVSFEIPRAGSKGQIVLRNARVVTMKGKQVLERGDILVRDGRIAAVGPAGSVRAPAGATSMDMTGKTIVPGLVDLHAHYSVRPGMTGIDVYPEQNTELLANLAYGVTTWRDPSARSQTLFDLAEMVEAGTTLGPRIYSTGDIFYVAEEVCCGQARSLDDAREMVRRQKALGATSIKEHTDPRREQVQWIIQASREEGLMAVMDPARGPRRELRTIIDGATSLEHLYAVTPVKKDVIEVFAKTGAWYVPTLILASVEDFYMTSANPHEDAKARRFIPHMKLDRDIHNYVRWRMPQEWPIARYAEVLRDIVRAGGKVGMGSHGQVQGLGAHWEMWAMASGGLTPHEVLWASTLSGAEALGLADDLGSLEAGKIADLLVLDRNPLTDIRNTNTIRYVMKGGVLWNGDTMDEVWPVKRTRPRSNWEGMFATPPSEGGR